MNYTFCLLSLVCMLFFGACQQQKDTSILIDESDIVLKKIPSYLVLDTVQDVIDFVQDQQIIRLDLDSGQLRVMPFVIDEVYEHWISNNISDSIELDMARNLSQPKGQIPNLQVQADNQRYILAGVLAPKLINDARWLNTAPYFLQLDANNKISDFLALDQCEQLSNDSLKLTHLNSIFMQNEELYLTIREQNDGAPKRSGIIKTTLQNIKSCKLNPSEIIWLDELHIDSSYNWFSRNNITSWKDDILVAGHRSLYRLNGQKLDLLFRLTQDQYLVTINAAQDHLVVSYTEKQGDSMMYKLSFFDNSYQQTEHTITLGSKAFVSQPLFYNNELLYLERQGEHMLLRRRTLPF